MSQSDFEKGNPFYRHPWLDRRYTFGGEFTFVVHDEVTGCNYGCSGHHIESLEVYPISLTEEQFSEWLRSALEKHSLVDCFLLNKDGEEIGQVRQWFTKKLPSNFSEVRFFALEDTIFRRKVVIYEVV